MSLKSKLSPKYYVPLSKLIGAKYPDELSLSNPNLSITEEDQSSAYEIIAYHGLSSKELITKLRKAENGGDTDINELSVYLNDQNTLNYDKSIFSDFILMFLGAFTILSMILIINNLDIIRPKLRSRFSYL